MVISDTFTSIVSSNLVDLCIFTNFKIRYIHPCVTLDNSMQFKKF